MRTQKRLLMVLTVLALLFAVPVAFAAEEASGSPLDALGINFGLMLSQLINFGLIFAVLTFAIFRSVIPMLEARQREIQKGLEDAAIAANARRNAEAEADKVLAQARSEASQVVEQGRVRGEELARSIEAEARAEGDRIRAEARQAAQVERDAELAGLRGQVAAIATAISQRLIGASLDQGRQNELITRFFAELPADVRGMTGDVTVTSAMPLEAAEQTRVKNELGTSNVTFTVNPAILGGLIIRSGDRVVDGSVRSRLNELSSRLS